MADGAATLVATMCTRPCGHVPLRRRKVGTGRPDLQSPTQAALFDRGPRRKEAHGALSQRGDGQRGIDPRIHGDATKVQVRSLAGALSQFLQGCRFLSGSIRPVPPGDVPFQPAELMQAPEDLDAKGILHTMIGSKPSVRMRRAIVPLAPASSEEENVDDL